VAKIYKTEIYFTDFNEEFQDEDHFKDHLIEICRKLWVGVDVTDIKKSKEFDWNDDLKINNVNVTKEDYEKYFE
jgi:hypothetical protein